MNKVTKTNTKEEILKALDVAIEEQSLLHKETKTLQEQVDKMTAQEEVKNAAIMDLNSKVVDFERQILEEDVKKKGLISQLASQTSDIELAKQKIKKYNGLKKTLISTTEELEAIKVKLLAKEKEVENLEEELTKPKKPAESKSGKKGGFFRPFLKVAAACSVIVFAVVVINLYIDTDLYPITSAKYDNEVVAISLDPNILTLTAEDGSSLEITGVDVSIAKWADEAGYDGVLYGKVLKTDEGKIVVTTADVYNYVAVDINKIAKKFEELDCYNILALVTNPDNIILPAPFKATSKGDLEFYEARRKLAGFVPVFWGKDKQVLYISSDNVHGFITSDGIFMKVEDTKAEVSFEKPEEGNVTDKASEVAGVDFSKPKGWIDNIKNPW